MEAPPDGLESGCFRSSPLAAAMNVRFIVIAPESKQGTFNVRLPVVVGRSEEAKFRIQQDRVSRKHCEFFAKDDQVFVRDLGSTNGTFLDDEQVETSVKIAVAPGAVVRVGSLAFRVEYGGVSGGRPTEEKPEPLAENDVTVGGKHAGDSERLKIHHTDDAADEKYEPEAVLPSAEIVGDAFHEEEPAAQGVEDAVAAPAPKIAAVAEPQPEQPPKKAAGNGFDFLSAEPVAEEEAAESAHWPGAETESDADNGPPDDEKLGDFFKGLQ